MTCYKSGGCGVYENRSCSECPASKPEYVNNNIEHGYWHSVYHYQDKASGICSVCQKHGDLRTDRNSFGIWFIDSPYCPACGSIMDGKIAYR